MSQDDDQNEGEKIDYPANIKAMKWAGVQGVGATLAIIPLFWYFEPGVIEKFPFIVPVVVLLAVLEVGLFRYLIRKLRKEQADNEGAPSAVQRSAR